MRDAKSFQVCLRVRGQSHAMATEAIGGNSGGNSGRSARGYRGGQAVNMLTAKQKLEVIEKLKPRGAKPYLTPNELKILEFLVRCEESGSPTQLSENKVAELLGVHRVAWMKLKCYGLIETTKSETGQKIKLARMTSGYAAWVEDLNGGKA